MAATEEAATIVWFPWAKHVGWYTCEEHQRRCSGISDVSMKTHCEDWYISRKFCADHRWCTNCPDMQYATASRDNATSWTYANKDSLLDSGFPSWGDSTGGYTWAPAVIKIGGTFVMYYTPRDTSLNTQCVGVATSSVASGPLVDTSSAPLVLSARSTRAGTLTSMCRPSMGRPSAVRGHKWDLVLTVQELRWQWSQPGEWYMDSAALCWWHHPGR